METSTLFRFLKVIYLSFLIIQVNTSLVLAYPDSGDGHKKIGDLLTGIYTNSEPGATIAVLKNDRVLFENSYGLADIEKTVSITPDKSFRIGSLTKQFTAVAIMKLVEAGDINVGDPVSKYLPGLLENGDVITVENLLTHTSGIGNFENLEKTMMDAAGQKLVLDDIIKLFIDRPAEFVVGTQYQYSNPGYILLGAIVEKVSGKSFEQFLREEILSPLEMGNTYFDNEEKRGVNRVQGYHREENEFVDAFAFNTAIPYSAGGLSSTIGDIRIWNDALWSGKIVSFDTLEKMITPFTLANGKQTEYGYGLEVLRVNKRPFIAHQGGIFGFQSFLATLPEDGIQIIILTNTDNPKVWPNEVADKIIEIISE